MFFCADAMDLSGTQVLRDHRFRRRLSSADYSAYEMNDTALPVAHGAPLRLRDERQLGYKMAKYVMRIELVADFTQIGNGSGGYWEDQGFQWWAGI